MAPLRTLARFLMVKATMTERFFNLVVPLAHEATAMRPRDTAGSSRDRSGAVSPLIGSGLRWGDVDSTNGRSTPPTRTTPGTRTSTTATRTTTTRAPRAELAPSADQYVRRKLLATGDRELVEDSWRDDFWGWGPNRDGQNMLGKLWMEVRGEVTA